MVRLRLELKVAVAAMFAFFPIVVGTQAGIRSVEPGHRDLAATLQATRRSVFLIDLPSALPSILTGMEVGIVLATIGAIVAEYLAGDGDSGTWPVVNLNQLKVDSLFGVIVLLSVMGSSCTPPWPASGGSSSRGIRRPTPGDHRCDRTDARHRTPEQVRAGLWRRSACQPLRPGGSSSPRSCSPGWRRSASGPSSCGSTRAWPWAWPASRSGGSCSSSPTGK